MKKILPVLICILGSMGCMDWSTYDFTLNLKGDWRHADSSSTEALPLQVLARVEGCDDVPSSAGLGTLEPQKW